MFNTKKIAKTFYLIDDDTVMPITCDSYEEAVEIVNNQLDGDLNRIYETTKVIKIKK